MTSKIDWEQYAARTNSEDAAQIALFGWAADNVGKYPQLKSLFHINNTVAAFGGKATGRLAAMGVRKGMLDVCLAYPMWQPRNAIDCVHMHGLYIEMKKLKKGVVSQDQKEWLVRLTENGYATRVCKGFIEARDALIEYLEGRWVQG